MIARFNPHATIVDTRVAVGPGSSLRLFRTLSTGELMVEELIPVEAAKPVCLRCLSHNVTLHQPPNAVSPMLICHDCGVRYSSAPADEPYTSPNDQTP